MRSLLTILLGIAIIASASSSAHARKLCFGTDENLRKVQDVDLKGPEGGKLHLARKISMDCFLLPYTVRDGGYVLAKEDGKTYFQLTDAQISEYQQQGSLPSPLPPFELSTLDKVFGHSLYLLVLFMIGWFAIDWLRKKGKEEA